VKAEWQDPGTPTAFRYFEGSRWVVDRPTTSLPLRTSWCASAARRTYGAVEREIVVDELHPDDAITAWQARRFVRALMALIDKIDVLNS
jgi:hypothetical protein